jgi:hypothetical protein
MNARFLLGLAAFSVSVPSVARAAENDENAREARHGVDVIGTGAGGVSFGRSATVALDVELAGYWKVSPRLAFGAVAARTWIIPPPTALGADGAGTVSTESVSRDTGVWRLAPAVRWDVHRGPWTRGWIGGELGVAFVVDRVDVYTAPVPTTYLGPSTETRTAPVVALDAGFALQPIDWVSLGVSARALHLATGTTSATRSAVNGPLDAVFVGLVLAVHVPMGPRDAT